MIMGPLKMLDPWGYIVIFKHVTYFAAIFALSVDHFTETYVTLTDTLIQLT